MLSRTAGSAPRLTPSNIEAPQSSASAPESAQASAAAAPPLQATTLERVAGAADLTDSLPTIDAATATAEATGTAVAAEAGAAADEFWLPNDIWSSITPFLSREDVLSLSATSIELVERADEAILSVKLSPDNLVAFMDSARFNSVNTVHFTMNDRTSLNDLKQLASMPTLAGLFIDGLDGPDLDVATVRALAANPKVQSLVLKSYGSGIDDDGLVALTHSTSLTLLSLPMRAAMPALAGIRFLKGLTFANYNRDMMGDEPLTEAQITRLIETPPYATLTVATAHSIAALPALQILNFGPLMKREVGALTVLLEHSSVRALWFSTDVGFTDEERSALMQNTKLKKVVVSDLSGLSNALDQNALLNHPTIDLVRIDDTLYTRVPGSNATLTANAAP